MQSPRRSPRTRPLLRRPRPPGPSRPRTPRRSRSRPSPGSPSSAWRDPCRRRPRKRSSTSAARPAFRSRPGVPHGQGRQGQLGQGGRDPARPGRPSARPRSRSCGRPSHAFGRPARRSSPTPTRSAAWASTPCSRRRLDLSVVPTADLWITGLYGESPYLHRLLEKVGRQTRFHDLRRLQERRGDLHARRAPARRPRPCRTGCSTASTTRR